MLAVYEKCCLSGVLPGICLKVRANMYVHHVCNYSRKWNPLSFYAFPMCGTCAHTYIGVDIHITVHVILCYVVTLYAH